MNTKAIHETIKNEEKRSEKVSCRRNSGNSMSLEMIICGWKDYPENRKAPTRSAFFVGIIFDSISVTSHHTVQMECIDQNFQSKVFVSKLTICSKYVLSVSSKVFSSSLSISRTPLTSPSTVTGTTISERDRELQAI